MLLEDQIANRSDLTKYIPLLGYMFAKDEFRYGVYSIRLKFFPA